MSADGLDLLASELQHKSLFITGGTGFFGRASLTLLERLHRELRLDFRVTVLSRNPENFRKACPQLAQLSFVEVIAGDVQSLRAPSLRYDYVLHFANLEHHRSGQVISPSPDPSSRLASQLNTDRVLKFAGDCGAKKFLLASSGAVYPAFRAQGVCEAEAPIVEPREIRPDAYAAAKAYAEWKGNVVGQAQGFEHKIARGFSFVGPELAASSRYAIADFIRDALSKASIEIQGNGNSLRSYLYSADLARWLLTILLRGEPARAYNVGSDQVVSILELAHQVREVVGRMLDTEINIEIKNQADTGFPIYVPNLQRAREELGLGVDTSLTRAIELTALAYREQLKS